MFQISYPFSGALVVPKNPSGFKALLNILQQAGGLLAPAQTPSWRTTPRQLSETVYSIYLRLPSIRNLRMRHDAVTRNPLNMAADSSVV
jgi:hypothetical protein